MSIDRAVGARRRRTTMISAAILAVASLIITGFALNHPGLSSSQVEVHDGGVWVTNQADGLMGRLNVDAAEFDARLSMVDDEADVVQSGYTLMETGSRGLTPVNTASVARSGMVETPPGTKVQLGGDRLALGAPDGRLWILSPDQAAAFAPSQVDPVHEGGGRLPVTTVSPSGTTFLLDGTELLTFARTDGSEAPEASSPVTVGGLTTSPEHLDLTTVGEVPVILDRENRLLRVGTEAREVDLTGLGISDLSQAVLQQPSATSDVALLATRDALVQIPLGIGGSPTQHPAGGNGTPTPPAQAGGCHYAAWNGSYRYLRDCSGSDPVVEAVPDVEQGSDLVLRQNRDLVVLNDQQFGLSWMISDQMQLIDDWVIRQEIQTREEEEIEVETLTSTITNVVEDREQENRDPIATDDDFGVRAGQNVVLPVTRNDSDPDGDVLTSSLVGDDPPLGTVSEIRGGTQLQISVDEDAAGSASFTYEVDDGRGGTDTATVTLSVQPPEENEPPRPAELAMTKVQVRSGETVTLNILPYWEDPDGDSFYLADATIPPEDLVSFRPDGQITIDDAGLTTGTTQVALTFRDEHGATAEGVLEVEATTDEDVPPITTADHLQLVAGQSSTISPLLNDLDPGGGGLELTHVASAAGLDIEADLVTGTVTMRGSSPGTYYVDYTVASGASSSPGLIRVDVIQPPEEDLVPVAVDDMAMVTTGGEVLIDPLENDVDPTGGVLVVNSIQVPESSGLRALVIGNHLIRIEAAVDATVGDEPIPLTYEVANAAGSSTGSVAVMVARTDTQFANPVAAPDEAVVRAGDMVMIDVLDNDLSPTDAELSLSGLTDVTGAEGLGHAELHQDRIRFSAEPGVAGPAWLTYEVTDETGRSSSARVEIEVVAEEAQNRPPLPENLVARTVAGSSVRIPVSLTGIDPDGDSVILMGITSPAPRLGEVTEATGEWIEYEPHPGQVGTDRFRYQVMDRHGALGTAEVLVGIAQPSAVNQPPDAVDDVIDARPDRVVQIPVLDNDTDPEGAVLHLVHENVVPTTDIEVISPEEAAGPTMLTVRTPAEAGTHSVMYEAGDGQLTGAATATVRVADNAPLRAPIATDDFIAAADVLDPDATEVRVDVLANDRDPDGTVDDLQVELVDPPEGAHLVDGGTVALVPGDEQMRLRYTITDPDGLSSAGYIWAPGRAQQAPVWVGGTLEVLEGARTTIDLGDPELVRVRPGGLAPVITDPELVTAGHSDGGPLVTDESTLQYRPQEGFTGRDTLTVEVIDGEPGSDTAAVATLAIPLRVTPAGSNLPPSFRGATLDVEIGGPASTLDLSASADDPEDEPLGFELGDFPATPDVTVGIEGDELVAQADAQALKGTMVQVPVSVSDGVNDPVEATFQVVVGGSSKPLPAAVLDTVEIHAGDEVSVAVLDNDSNPFPEQPLSLVGASLVSGQGAVRAEGSEVVITPDPDFAGVLTATYSVQDATGDTDRRVAGEIRATVLGLPETPSAPRIGQVGDGTVELIITAGDDNGSPITGYTVTSATGPPVDQDCASTSCTLTGLENGAEHTFQVVARNAVGESEPSAPSAAARPDVRPEPPGTPSAQRGDRQLTVSWTSPVNRGSALQHYELQRQNTAGGTLETRQIDSASTSTTWDGLDNGTDYRFRVRAHNLAEEPSDWSQWSAPEHPAGPPLAPENAPSVRRVNDVMGGGVTITVPPLSDAQANGEPVTAYEIVASDGTRREVDAGADSVTLRGLDPATSYTFTYVAINAEGRSGASPPSAAVVPFAVPEAPTDVVATMPDQGTGAGPNGRATVTWSAAESRGTPISEYVVTWDGGSRTVGADVRSLEVSGLSNGSAYTFSVQARNGHQGGESAPAASDSVTPYTTPGEPRARVGTHDCTTATTSCLIPVHVDVTRDGGSPVTTLEYQLPDAPGRQWTTVPVQADGTATINVEAPASGDFRVDLRVTTAGGLTSRTTATVGVPPGDPDGPTAKVPMLTSLTCGGSSVRYWVELSGLEPGTEYEVHYAGEDGQWRTDPFTLTAESATWDSGSGCFDPVANGGFQVWVDGELIATWYYTGI